MADDERADALDGLGERRPSSPAGAEPATFAQPDDGGGSPPIHLSEIDARLARVEQLLSADLDALGPAVLAASIDDLEERIRRLAVRLDAMISVAGLLGQSAGDSADIPARLDKIEARLTVISRTLIG